VIINPNIIGKVIKSREQFALFKQHCQTLVLKSGQDKKNNLFTRKYWIYPEYKNQTRKQFRTSNAAGGVGGQEDDNNQDSDYSDEQIDNEQDRVSGMQAIINGFPDPLQHIIGFYVTEVSQQVKEGAAKQAVQNIKPLMESAQEQYYIAQNNN
jgi:hypothetical protein